MSSQRIDFRGLGVGPIHPLSVAWFCPTCRAHSAIRFKGSNVLASEAATRLAPLVAADHATKCPTCLGVPVVEEAR